MINHFFFENLINNFIHYDVLLKNISKYIPQSPKKITITNHYMYNVTTSKNNKRVDERYTNVSM